MPHGVCPPLAARGSISRAESVGRTLGTVDIRADQAQPPRLVCSARGCRDVAHWALRWNNPSLHTPDRRKTWLACDVHRESLGGFLSVRGFLRETVPTDVLPAAPEPEM